jgi:hypothetical protein
MEALSTIRKMMAGNKIIVPSYQRAYSWETPVEKTDRNKQTDVFLNDLEDYRRSQAITPYYFGHFLFERKDEKYYVVDGQQRLTTIVIYLSALFTKLKQIRNLTEEEIIHYEDMVKRRNTIGFTTVDYDNQIFIDYVIDQTKEKNIDLLETESQRRIVKAFEYFQDDLSDKSEEYLTRMFSIISDSICTTHQVQNASEAIQMFIFQNNRGKKPSNLEIIKAQFMYNVHLYGNGDNNEIIEEIEHRFEYIYKSISKIEYRINEDDVLLYTLRVYFNSLWEGNALEKIDKMLSGENPIGFIRDFTRSLEESFRYLSVFFGEAEKNNFAVHSLVTLGRIAIAFPFIIKAYKFGLESHIGELCAPLEDLVIRHRLIGTRALLTSRINEVFVKFTENSKDIRPITERVEWMKTTKEWWWAYWNNESLEKSLQGEIDHSIAKYLLWKYEFFLGKEGQEGYKSPRFDRIESPELEHIAPRTEPAEKPHGYGEYDDEFRDQYIDCLGNYLLLSKSHNCSVGNVPFSEKHKTYCKNEQQREIQKLVPENEVWNKEVIQRRKEKIIQFIMDSC